MYVKTESVLWVVNVMGACIQKVSTLKHVHTTSTLHRSFPSVYLNCSFAAVSSVLLKKTTLLIHIAFLFSELATGMTTVT